MRSLVGLLFLGMSLAFAAQDVYHFSDPASRVRFQQLSHQFRCLVCQNEDLAGSSAPLAADLRARIAAQIRQGKSDAAIKKYMVTRFVDFVLYEPPLKPATWLLWLAPFGLLVVAFGILFTAIARQRKAGSQ